MKQTLFLAVFAGVVLTGIYTIITLYDSNMKIGRLNQTPVIRPHEEPLLLMDKRTAASDKGRALAIEKLIKEELNSTFSTSTTAAGSIEMNLAMGAKDYQSFCSHCHGVNLDGLGTVGQSFFPLPTNLTGKNTTDLSDQEMFYFISYGSKKTPALATSMSVASRKAVVRYIRFIQKTNN